MSIWVCDNIVIVLSHQIEELIQRSNLFTRNQLILPYSVEFALLNFSSAWCTSTILRCVGITMFLDRCKEFDVKNKLSYLYMHTRIDGAYY